MIRSGNKTWFVALHLGYAVILWWLGAHPRRAVGGGFGALTLALVLVTVMFLYAWRPLVGDVTQDHGDRVWLLFLSGVWVGAAIGAYVVLAFLNAVALSWG